MNPSSIHRCYSALLAIVPLSCWLSIGAAAQVPPLPDAPGPDANTLAASPDPALPGARAVTTALPLPMPQASPTTKLIQPDQHAPILTAGDKARLGLKNAFMPPAIAGWFAVAGYEQVTNGSPNYGTDRGAFGRRLGDAAIRDSSEDIVGDSLLSPLFREDPRYYRLGPTHNFFARVVYAGTRPLFTRSDSGHSSVNFALLTATAGGAAFTNIYYPEANHGVGQTLETFGGSMGGSALGDLVSEFADDLMNHFRHTQR